MRRRLKYIALGSAVIFVSLCAAFVWLIVQEPAPEFFPFNEKNAQYFITKSPNGIYFVKYKGPSIYSDGLAKDENGYITIMIGKTPYELSNYLDSEVIILRGSFQNGFSTQCIHEVCSSIGGPYAAVVIDEIQKK